MRVTKHGFQGKRIQIFFSFIVASTLLGVPAILTGAAMPQVPSPEMQSFPQQSPPLPSASDQSNDTILSLILQVNVSDLHDYVQHIQDFGPHPTGSKACTALGTYLYDTLSSFNLSVRYDPWFHKLRHGNNIEATLPGDSNRVVILSAHYDSVYVSPGADDDGSGVAAVLASAAILSHYRFNCTIKFVLFSGEEQGLYGSHEYVRKAHASKENILADLNLDGVGYAATAKDGRTVKHHADNQSAWMTDISDHIASAYRSVIGLDVLKLPAVTFSDQASFMDYQYEASYLYEYALDPYYHTSEDRLEHMNFTYLAKVCRLAVGTFATIAELHPLLNDTDLKITIRGTVRGFPTQFTVRIENKKYTIDSANVTISITMRNLFTGEYVKNSYNVSCNWSLVEEIAQSWEFSTVSRKYQPQMITLEVVVKGLNDDVTLYATQRAVGIIVGLPILLLPT